ncbi:hypothetical protein SAY87_026521 [Trapa incisa]|uniref:Uncharacterized protein n=1 Tax=Trapa incisa TaxID=236973 RepID=A0AAN7GXZ7_9MYRT|nr:hypothetical protein SAY87_026521 [Trapa incisa]
MFMGVHGHHLNPKSRSISNLRSKSTSSSQRKVLHPKMTPALYAMPETPPPLQDSPTSFPPSPYIINHKRRDPCLGKNQPGNASSLKKTKDEEDVSVGAVEISDQLVAPAWDIPDVHLMPLVAPAGDIPDVHPMPLAGEHVRVNRDSGGYKVQSGTPHKGEVAKTKPRENENLNDYLLRIARDKIEFVDGDRQNMHNCWGRVKEQLSLVGLSLIADPTIGTEQIGADSTEELFQYVYTSRFVSEAIGRGIAKAEAEVMMEVQLEAKNFEIAKLWDCLYYYEAVNSEEETTKRLLKQQDGLSKFERGNNNGFRDCYYHINWSCCTVMDLLPSRKGFIST